MSLAAQVAIGGATRVVLVLGDPVAHSLSPPMLNAGFVAAGLDLVMVPVQVSAAGFAAFLAGLRGTQVVGASVTLPHKQAALRCCDETDDAAREMGAVNCLVLRDGRVLGHNTDGAGFLAALSESGQEVAGKTAVILGAGGAARGVQVALAHAGATTVVAARRPQQIDWMNPGGPGPRVVAWDGLAEVLRMADLVVDATSAAMFPDHETAFVESVPLAALPSTALLYSLVYHRAPLLAVAARDRGLATLDGTGMLLHQAGRAFELWTGQAAPLELMRVALASARTTSHRAPRGGE